MGSLYLKNMKKKDIEAVENKKNEIKVKFTNTYLGKLGNFYKDKIYIIPVEIFKLLNIDCKEID